jgi:hypothetical protein
MRARLTWQRIGAGLALLVGATALDACGGGMNPFASASAIDLEFAQAAITWDLNHDGDVTCDEWKRYVADLFREADANRDGFLSREEFAVMATRDRLFQTAGFGYFDGNGDGRLTLAEIADKPNPAFRLLDVDQDCRITPEERSSQRGQHAHGKGKHQP